ncbi:M20/M25/M40 family metallo-hydrolase [Virgibacillus halophilus]|uniref:M20/M25/M40 family metallo-hydrolase n=1 Tax=Tigheibacillus halophilus TaxID=361280 RepID=A0ABU5C3Q7_9BACI|nr:M20/M25/M40 family metallo-hydrolase [Virgibacillus halophilus]
MKSAAFLILSSISSVPTLKKEVASISEKRKITIAVDDISRSKPIVVKEKVRDLLTKACEDVADNIVALPSGAGHDANQMSLLGPAGMLFIPCKDGRSHCPEEWAEKEDVCLGAEAMLRAVLHFCEMEAT